MYGSVVILAGGFGERLWPLSRDAEPKQFIKINGGFSFFQNAVLRALSFPDAKIIIVTRGELLEKVASECAVLDKKDRIIIASESQARHTCAAVLFAIHLSAALETEETTLVLTSDHVISPLSSFLEDSKVAADEAKGDFLVTFGIKPTFPATSYGYIQTEKEAGKALKVLNFKEKPDEETAKKYIKSGNCFWNSGMFAFTRKFFLKELKLHSPAIYDSFLPLSENFSPEFYEMNGIKILRITPLIKDAYEKVPSAPIDTALAEKTKRIRVVPASFEWDDVGSFESLSRYVAESEAVRVESKGCFVYSDMPVTLCGVEDLNVIIKNGKALVMRRGRDDLLRLAVKKNREKQDAGY